MNQAISWRRIRDDLIYIWRKKERPITYTIKFNYFIDVNYFLFNFQFYLFNLISYFQYIHINFNHNLVFHIIIPNEVINGEEIRGINIYKMLM